jgi:hypothetical protein
MRSTEIGEHSYKVLVGAQSQAWDYATAFDATPIQYFENTDVQAKANEKAAQGSEVVRPSGEQLVGIQHIWDRGTYFDKYKEENGGVGYDWASWKHWGVSGNTVDKGEYSVRRFAAYFEMDAGALAAADKAVIAPTDELDGMSYLFPINDNVFVFVNEQLVYWGGTDVIAGNNQYGALNRDTYMGKSGVPVRDGVNGVFKSIYPHTDGWCIDLETNAAEINIRPFLQQGFNRIDIFADEYWEGGGMNRLKLFFTQQ